MPSAKTWSDCTDGQADLSLCWSLKSYFSFCHGQPHLFYSTLPGSSGSTSEGHLVGAEKTVWMSGLCDWCRGCMQMRGAVSVLVRGTVKNLKWMLVFTKDQYSARWSSSLCLKPYHESSALGSPGKTSMLVTLLSSPNRLRNVSGDSWQ